MAKDRNADKEFGKLLLKSVQDLSKRIEEMGQRLIVESRPRETPRVFHIGEGLGTSHHLPEHPTAQQVALHTPPHSTMPTFLAADIGAKAQQEHEQAHMGDYFSEYQSYG